MCSGTKSFHLGEKNLLYTAMLTFRLVFCKRFSAITHIARNRPKGGKFSKKMGFLDQNFAKNRLIAKFLMLIARILSVSPNFAHFFVPSPKICAYRQRVPFIANFGDFGDEIAHLAALLGLADPIWGHLKLAELRSNR